MTCTPVRTPSGVAVVCGPRGPRRRCSCGAWARLLCDHPAGEGKTCDAPMCSQCAVEVGPDRHHCPAHAVPAAESYPQYWIGRRCPHWSAEQNRRFRLYRIDGPTDHVGHHPGAVFDADRRAWLDQARLGGIAGHELARRAKPAEIPAAAEKPRQGTLL